jgi:hypothetical protein
MNNAHNNIKEVLTADELEEFEDWLDSIWDQSVEQED